MALIVLSMRAMRLHRRLVWEKSVVVGLMAVAMASSCDGGAERCADCLQQSAVGHPAGRGGAAGTDSPALAGSSGRDGTAGLGSGGQGGVTGAGASPSVAGTGGAG